MKPRQPRQPGFIYTLWMISVMGIGVLLFKIVDTVHIVAEKVNNPIYEVYVVQSIDGQVFVLPPKKM